MRLDVFLPFLRKPKKNASKVRPPAVPLVFRLLRAVIPKRLQSDSTTGKPGLVRRWLKRIGSTWLSSPLRRIAQSAFLLLFAWLFFYVCYPYDARPSRAWRNMQPTAINEQDEITLKPTSIPIAFPNATSSLFAVTETTSEDANTLGPVRVLRVEQNSITVTPLSGFAKEKLDELRFDIGGPWTLSEVSPGSWPSHYADNLSRKESIHAESILIIDPLVAFSTAIASRTWVWSLVSAVGILVLAVVVPRGFCGWICPLGTVIDLFDWLVGKRVTRFRVGDEGWWVHIKYYLLLSILIASCFGILISGYFAAIPVVTRGFLFLFDPLQVAYARGWHNVPPISAGHVLSIALFFGVLGLGLLKPRFWCKYVCPSGAVFSVGNLFRLSERKVEDTCIHCNKCVEICPFDAIKADFTTRTTDCTLCQTCGGVCPTQAIKFVERWNVVELKLPNDPPTHEGPIGRRGFLSLAAGTVASVVGASGAVFATKMFGADVGHDSSPPIRPPGSLPEVEFLSACIRCGECFKACPNNVLQPLGFQQGLEGLWTPAVNANWAGCESSCNACGQVCPTGAIRALPLAEKKVARIGLAVVNQKTCLPYAQVEACQLCVDECESAGYHAIEFTRVGTQVTSDGVPIEDTGFLAPIVVSDRCVGCGLCQTRCYGINVLAKHHFSESAIIIEAGAGKEDRLLNGSYVELREQEQESRRQNTRQEKQPADYLPDFLK